MRTTPLILLLLAAVLGSASVASELHVGLQGNDQNCGSKALPLRTIQRAAELAQPGDVITVHAGTYRERVNPPRGGTSERVRIVYQAGPGEKVEIKGSEPVKNWTRTQDDVWQVTLPNSFFGKFNPYQDVIRGDWFEPKGREHHTGAVYLNGDWLIEATKLGEVQMPAGKAPAWLSQGGGCLLNIAWLKACPNAATKRLPATSFSKKSGTQNAACSEGGDCIGFIEAGHWVSYEQVDFGSGSDEMEMRASSASAGGVIEIRLGDAEGELLGSCVIPNTGGWQAWSTFKTRIKRVSGSKAVCLAFKGRQGEAANPGLWFAKVGDSNTVIWAQFRGLNPNEQTVEINVRQTVFYPDHPGRNYITVRGFTMQHAATPWAPPTAEQLGLIGTHWSKGWVIEDNVVSHSICCGIALGKHGDEYDNTSANTAEGYVKTIERALKRGWNKETIGHHLVRNNTISHCEQAGVVGSMGAAFSTVTGNTIHDIHVRRLFTGAEMAGIKFHAAIDTTISHNHIYRTCLGLWLDWMAQGTRVSRNLFHDNAGQDLFVEVDHGPFVVDNNLFLSGTSLLDVSEGGAYVHNLFNGRLITQPEPGRETPYHPAHSTSLAGLAKIKGGDDRFYNNIFVGNNEPPPSASPDPQWSGGHGLWVYNFREFPLQTTGNVFLNSARPYGKESNAVVVSPSQPKAELVEHSGEWFLRITPGEDLRKAETRPVTTALLGKARIPNVAYESADGTPLNVNRDFFGKKRSSTKPTAGPFERPGTGQLILKVW